MNHFEHGDASARLSVIIPTLNEADMLPALLQALRSQTRPPDEVIVADARSSDGTADIARAYGARVVAGGHPGAGRNAGAAAATGDVLVFLDADVLPGPEYLAALLAEFARRRCDVGTGLLKAGSTRFAERFAAGSYNVNIQAIAAFVPHGAGFCIVVRRSLHEAIGGFDEGLVMAEDVDYLARAAKQGRYCVLRDARLIVSLRRFDRDGYARTALKYAWCELRLLTGRPIRAVPFQYAFGPYTTDRPGPTASAATPPIAPPARTSGSGRGGGKARPARTGQPLDVAPPGAHHVPMPATRRRRTLALLGGVIGVVMLIAIAVVLVQAHQAAMTTVHPPRLVAQPRPEAFGLPYEDVAFETADGVALKGWFIPPSGPERAALIVNPGHGDHRGKAITATAMLADHGYGVLTFDWRAVGESGGEAATIGYDEKLDVLAAVDWLAARPDVDPARIGALSRSAGAAAVIHAAADEPRLAAVVAETTFSSLEDMLATGVEAKTGLPAFPFAPLIVFFSERETGRRIGDNRPVDVIGRIAPRAVLIIRGGRDIWVPPDNADKLFAAAGEPKELWHAATAEHALVQDADPAEYERRLVAFFDRYLK